MAEPAEPRAYARLNAVGEGILVLDDRDGTTADVPESVDVSEPSGVGPAEVQDATSVPLATTVTIAACVLATLVLGEWAAPLSALAAHATMLFHP